MDLCVVRAVDRLQNDPGGVFLGEECLGLPDGPGSHVLTVVRRSVYRSLWRMGACHRVSPTGEVRAIVDRHTGIPMCMFSRLRKCLGLDCELDKNNDDAARALKVGQTALDGRTSARQQAILEKHAKRAEKHAQFWDLQAEKYKEGQEQINRRTKALEVRMLITKLNSQLKQLAEVAPRSARKFRTDVRGNIKQIHKFQMELASLEPPTEQERAQNDEMKKLLDALNDVDVNNVISPEELRSRINALKE